MNSSELRAFLIAQDAANDPYNGERRIYQGQPPVPIQEPGGSHPRIRIGSNDPRVQLWGIESATQNQVYVVTIRSRSAAQCENIRYWLSLDSGTTLFRVNLKVAEDWKGGARLFFVRD